MLDSTLSIYVTLKSSLGTSKVQNCLLIYRIMIIHWTCGALVVCLLEWWVITNSFYLLIFLKLFSATGFCLQIFRKEPFFYGQDNQDQLVKIAKVWYRFLTILIIVQSIVFWWSILECLIKACWGLHHFTFYCLV